jgi:acetylxylan esterase
MKEWSNVLGVSWSQNISNTPIAGYTKMVYGDGTKLIGFSAMDVGHSVPVRTEDDLVWFGLMPLSSTTSIAMSSKPAQLYQQAPPHPLQVQLALLLTGDNGRDS